MMLSGIATRDKKRAPMVTHGRIEVTREAGLKGDCKGKLGPIGTGRRQVTILSAEQWLDACAEVGAELEWTIRRANLLATGLMCHKDLVGKHLYIGSDPIILEVTGETDPCNRMDEAYQGLQAALAKDWRGGLTCRVIQGGLAILNASIHIE